MIRQTKKPYPYKYVSMKFVTHLNKNAPVDYRDNFKDKIELGHNSIQVLVIVIENEDYAGRMK